MDLKNKIRRIRSEGKKSNQPIFNCKAKKHNKRSEHMHNQAITE